MDDSVIDIRDRILNAALPNIAFDGWTWATVEQAAMQAGYDRTMAIAVFPGKLANVVDHFTDWADRAMLVALTDINRDGMKIREQVRLAVSSRFKVLQPWREATALAARYLSVPHRARFAARTTWRTADRIWIWAGDTATDYNRVTKRLLLSGVLTSTMLAWLADKEGDMDRLDAFLIRRIDNVMRVGGLMGRVKGRFSGRSAGPKGSAHG